MTVFIECVGVTLQAIVATIIIDRLSDIKVESKTYIAKLICICLNFLIWYYIKDLGRWSYSVVTLFEILNFSLYTITLKRQKFIASFATVTASIILNVFSGLILAVLIYISFNVNRSNSYVYIFITMLTVAVLFCIVWIRDLYYAEREKKQLWEDNFKMSERLHKSKEILSLLNYVLNKIKNNNDFEEFNELISEVRKLCSEQIDESENDDMQYKSFPCTGLHILDEQIQLYGKEAATKGINFDVFVNVKMSDALNKHNISNLEFLRLIGNLMRNAFRSVEKKGTGNILLIMGCVNEALEVEIYDDGVTFPIHILNEFGKRGNTDGGTGHGIAEMLDILNRYNASYKLTEYDGDMGFTKGISIIWNNQNQRWLETFRFNQISENSIFD